jgi:hypothetical protein
VITSTINASYASEVAASPIQVDAILKSSALRDANNLSPSAKQQLRESVSKIQDTLNAQYDVIQKSIGTNKNRLDALNAQIAKLDADTSMATLMSVLPKSSTSDPTVSATLVGSKKYVDTYESFYEELVYRSKMKTLRAGLLQAELDDIQAVITNLSRLKLALGA